MRILIAALVLFSASAFAQTTTYIPQVATQAQVAPTGSDQLALAGNAKRRAFRLTNNTDAVCAVAYGTTAVASRGIQLPAAGTLFDEFYAGNIRVLCGGTGNLTVIETTP